MSDEREYDFRCPVHDKVFRAKKPPTNEGHAKCEFCAADRAPKQLELPTEGTN